MSTDLKSSKEVLEVFFERIQKDEQLDTDTVEAITGLYEEGKLSALKLTDALSTLREGADNGAN